MANKYKRERPTVYITLDGAIVTKEMQKSSVKFASDCRSAFYAESTEGLHPEKLDRQLGHNARMSPRMRSMIKYHANDMDWRWWVFELPAFTPRVTALVPKSDLNDTGYAHGCDYVHNIGPDMVYKNPYTGNKFLVSPSGIVLTGPYAGAPVYGVPSFITYFIMKFGIKHLSYEFKCRSSMLDRRMSLTGWSFSSTGKLRSIFADLEERVKLKIKHGTYVPLHKDFPTKFGTGAHLSTHTDTLLAYYPTMQHIERDVPQKIKPGKYLKTYFPEMHDDDIRKAAALVTGAGMEIRTFSKGEDIIRIYMELANSGIVNSCMSKEQWTPHPLMVYDESDVELAALYFNDQPFARALYNKHTREYPMVYGQWERMRVALDKAGFKHGSLEGAKIKRIEHKKGWVRMPYIDGHRKLDRSENNATYVDILDDYVVITKNGSYRANSHDTASIHIGNTVEHEYEYYCDCCGDGIEDEDDRIWLKWEEVYIGPCCEHHASEIFVQSNRYAITCYDGAHSDAIEINGNYYADSDAAIYHGFKYSEYDDAYYPEEEVERTHDDVTFHNEHIDIIFFDVDGEYYDVADIKDFCYWDTHGEELGHKNNVRDETEYVEEGTFRYVRVTDLRECPENFNHNLWTAIHPFNPTNPLAVAA